VVAVGEAATAIPAPERHDQPSLCDQAWICVCGNQPHKDGLLSLQFRGQAGEACGGRMDHQLLCLWPVRTHHKHGAIKTLQEEM
jgi:hypothetical protein